MAVVDASNLFGKDHPGEKQMSEKECIQQQKLE